MTPPTPPPPTQHDRVADSVHPSESAAAAADFPLDSPLAALLTRHVLSDGEIVLLMLKPSPWFIVFTSLKFAAVVIILAIAGKIYQDHLHIGAVPQTAALILSGRLMVAALQWMGRYYILTDLRILRVGGVFRVDIFACPLRKVARTRVLRTLRDRLFGVGSIEIIPQDEKLPIGLWQTIGRPLKIHEQVAAAINKAKQCGRGTGG